MGLFESIFKRPNRANDAGQYFQTLTAYRPVFSSFEGGLYEMELTRAAVHAVANHVSKLKPEVIGAAKPHLARTLAYRPNPFSSTPQFLYRLATILLVNNTAFIVPIEDGFGDIIGYYPALPQLCEVMEVSGRPYLRYTFSSGKRATIELERAGVLTMHQYRDDFFGENNAAMNPTMQLIHTQNQGIQEGVKNSATFRFMAQSSNFAKGTDLTAERKRFTTENFAAEESGGLLLFPNTYTNIQQIKSQPFVVDAAQMQAIQANVFNYFGVNEEILQNKAIGDSWAAFYEGQIEPLSIQISTVMTNMTFTDRERSTGNQIFLTANRLQYMTNNDKLRVSTLMFDRGLMNRNEIREIWNLPPLDDGDGYYIRGEYHPTKEEPT
ncbi:phage portal protein [Oscillospiraceae bacterium LTW-04]|nr:phage portal protein [Oscillospiraceae bacterium MB24-C1]